MKALRYRNRYVTEVMQKSDNSSEWNDVSHEIAEGDAKVGNMVKCHLNKLWLSFLKENVSYELTQGISQEYKTSIVIVHAHRSKGCILKSRAEHSIAA